MLAGLLWQRDNTGLNAENNELKLRVQTMEKQVHLQDGMAFIFFFFLYILITNLLVNTKLQNSELVF